MDAEKGAADPHQGVDQRAASLPSSSVVSGQSSLSPHPFLPSSTRPSSSSAPSSFPFCSPSSSSDRSSFVPRCVLVTVGTTSFDSLLSAVLETSFLKLLLRSGCRSLRLQVGKGDISGLFSVFSSPSPTSRPEVSLSSSCTSAVSPLDSRSHGGKRDASAIPQGTPRGRSSRVRASLPNFEAETTERREASPRRPFFSRLVPLDEEGTFTLFFEEEHEVSTSHDETAQDMHQRVSARKATSSSPASSLPLRSPRTAAQSCLLPPASRANSLSVSYFRFKSSLEEDLREADVVISHCGAGTVLQTLRLGKRLVAVVNEALMNNHQLELGEELQERGHCLLVTHLQPASANPARKDSGASLGDVSTTTSGAVGNWLHWAFRGWNKDATKEGKTASGNDLHEAFRRICQAEWGTARAESSSLCPPSPRRPVCTSSSSLSPSPPTGGNLTLVPLPEADLRGFYAVLEEVLGVTPVCERNEEAAQ